MPGLAPKAGDRASWSGIYYATPHDAGLDARSISITTPAERCPAWRIDGAPSTWAIHIHGLGSTRASTLRGVLTATDLGYTSLVVTYRNTEKGPRVGTGRSTLGHTETADVDEAIGYAVRRGARQIVLFGWSMGAAIALQLTARAAELSTPTLILHGTQDDSAPIQLSQALRDTRPDLIELETFDADHTLSWNTDPDRWQATVTSWLRERISR